MRSRDLFCHPHTFAVAAWDKDTGPFQETLDYIFVSEHWAVEGCKALPPKGAVSALPGFPSSDEPSDHVLIAADLVF